MTGKTKESASKQDVEARVGAMDWNRIHADLDANGNAMIESFLTKDECRSMAKLYDSDAQFRKTITMANHGYGQGEYKYFSYPLPELVQDLRTAVYPHLAPLANKWHELMKLDARFPDTHAEFLDRCHKAGQVRPTPLMLKYVKDDFNCLHQDLYGEHVFPVQLAVLLSDPTTEFAGGEFIMTEQRPRMQSKAIVVPLKQGDAVIFAVHNRPVKGSRGTYRVNMRHGVSAVRSGHRQTMGIIFHDAK